MCMFIIKLFLLLVSGRDALYFVSLGVLSVYQDTIVRFAAGRSVVMVVAPLFLVEALLFF